MPRTLAFFLFVVLAALLLIVLGNPFYIVREGTQVVVTRFGEPVSGAITDTGLHVKAPFIDAVNRFDRRLLEWDGDPNQIPTKDKRFIYIDTMARWKIEDPLRFFQTVGNELGAQARLDDVIDSATRDVITERNLIEIVRSSNRLIELNLIEQADYEGDMDVREVIKLGREKLTREILERARTVTPKYGINLVDVRVKRINYIEEVREKIYERMIAERKKAAEQFRAEGQGRQAEIEGRKERDLKQITSEAYRKAQEIKGKADAEAAAIYADAYNQDAEFYEFTKTLETYQSTVDQDTTLILTTEGDYFKYLKKASP